MHMIMFVLDDPDHLDEVLDAWEAVGVSGVTIFETSGIQRRRMQRQQRVPVRFGFEPVPVSPEAGNYTLFTIVATESMARKCIAAAETVVGNLDGPNTGVLAAWPLAVVKGVPPEVSAEAK